MAECKFCGKPAGFMNAEHPQCRSRHDDGTKKIREGFVRWLDTDYPVDRFYSETQSFAASHFIRDAELNSVIVDGFTAFIDKVLDDHLLTHERRANSYRFCSNFISP